MLMNAGLCNFFVGCCMSYKNIVALSPVGTLSTYITSLSRFMVTLSEISMISSTVFALTNFLSSKTCNCPKMLSVCLLCFSSSISSLTRSTGTSSSSVNSLSCSCWGSTLSVNVSFVAVVLLVCGGNWGLSRLR